jgi:cell division septation protein DedD
MSAERKKLLWISISACVFVLLLLATGFFLLAPKKGSAQAPATVGNSAPPKAQDPQDYLSAPPTSPAIEQPKAPDGGVIVVYGDKPTLPAATTPTSPLPQVQPIPASDAASAEATGSGESAAPAVPAKKATAAKQTAGSATGAAAGSAPAKAAAAKPAAKQAAVKASEYWIQAGSFSSRGRADELKQSLAEKGMAALIIVKDVSGKSYYRVRIGPYASEPEAKGWLTKISGLPGCAGAYVSKTAAKK